MKVVIARVDEVLFDGEAESLTVPAGAGEMTVLGSHMPLITTLKAGEIRIKTSHTPSETFRMTIADGVLEVRRDGATVIL